MNIFYKMDEKISWKLTFQFQLVDSHLLLFILCFHRENGLIKFAAYSDKGYAELSMREMNK
jgi:hypothetical protein